MITCGCKGKYCNGIVQKAQPRKIVDGVVYALRCGEKKEKENANSLKLKSDKK